MCANRNLLLIISLMVLALGFGACDAETDDQPVVNEVEGDVDVTSDNAEDTLGTDETDTGDTEDTSASVVEGPSCDGLAEGLNVGFEVNGIERSFYLDLPEGIEDGGPWPVIFSWKGITVLAEEHRHHIANLVDNDIMPFIGVTAVDSEFAIDGLIPVEWHVTDPDPRINREVKLFDQILRCVDERWGLDKNRIHTTGMSLGGIVSDMLGVVRGDVIASVATYSGGYGNNPQIADYWPPALLIYIEWPEFTHQNRYPQMFLYGGEEDIYEWEDVGQMIPFNEATPHDLAWLNERGHDAILCDHSEAHDIPNDQYHTSLIQFFYDHPLGHNDLAYEDGLPSAFPEYCEISLSE